MNDNEIQRVQNNTILAEQSLVGALLIENSLFNEIDVTAEQFFLSECAMIFSAMEALHQQRKPFDLMTVSEWLSTKRNVDYFTEIAAYVRNTPSAANGKTYAEKVKEYWKSREACRIASELQQVRLTNDPDLIDSAISQLMALNKTAKNFNHSAADVIDSALKSVQEAYESADGCIGLPTGIKDLDEVTGGLVATDLMIVAARPAMGKTALLLNMLCRSERINPGIISAEQANNQVGMRLLSIHGAVNGARMRKGELEDEEMTNLTNAAAKLYHSNFWVNDKPGMSINDIERQARQWVHENGVNAIGVDYLQKIKHPDTRLSKTDQIGDIAVRLKDLAKELNVPVVALAQVNRQVESRNDKRPGMSDIKDCGIIEQEADEILTLYRDEVYNEGTQDHGIAEIAFCKNRHGPTGVKRVSWIGKYMQFNDLYVSKYD